MKRSQHGFTLIEVLVALAMFVAVALALDSALSANVRGVVRFEEKSMAAWVASNKLVEMQVYQQWPSPGRQDDESEFAGRTWFVETTVSEGPYPGTRKAVIGVGIKPEGIMADKAPVSTLTALLVQPSQNEVKTAPAGGGP